MYEVIAVASTAARKAEPLGTKTKFWIDHPRRLFKASRVSSGEDWAEKVASEIASLLALPHATYTLAKWQTEVGTVRGTVTEDFCPTNTALVHGNELLAQADPEYAKRVSKFHVSAHTVERVFNVLKQRNVSLLSGYPMPLEIFSAADVFIGYLLLDALIGNTDRHDQNWGVLQLEDDSLELAPTFDHASSLGCHLTEDNKKQRLKTRDKNYTVAFYAMNAKSALYSAASDEQPLSTLSAFIQAAGYNPKAALYWISRAEALEGQHFTHLLHSVSRDLLPEASAEFAQRLLVINRDRLVEAGKSLT